MESAGKISNEHHNLMTPVSTIVLAAGYQLASSCQMFIAQCHLGGSVLGATFLRSLHGLFSTRQSSGMLPKLACISVMLQHWRSSVIGARQQSLAPGSVMLYIYSCGFATTGAWHNIFYTADVMYRQYYVMALEYIAIYNKAQSV